MPFGRRGSSTPNEDPQPVDAAPIDEGKGRPTPKRSEAQKARRNPSPGGNRKEATAAQRDRARADRQRARKALMTGDERYLPPRDAGPERKLARDIVDARFTYGQVFVVVIGVVFVLGGFIPSDDVRSVANIAGIVSLAIIVFDSSRHGRAAKAAVAAQFGEAQARGISSYAFMRAMLPRRFRRPPPKVVRGGGPIPSKP